MFNGEGFGRATNEWNLEPLYCWTKTIPLYLLSALRASRPGVKDDYRRCPVVARARLAQRVHNKMEITQSRKWRSSHQQGLGRSVGLVAKAIIFVKNTSLTYRHLHLLAPVPFYLWASRRGLPLISAAFLCLRERERERERGGGVEEGGIAVGWKGVGVGRSQCFGLWRLL